MKVKIEDIQKCECGALTIYFDNSSNNSMKPKTFKKLFKDVELKTTLNKTYSCNHCINHWGLDLCGCGSGEKLGKCKGDFEPCKNKTSFQELTVKYKFIGWAS